MRSYTRSAVIGAVVWATLPLVLPAAESWQWILRQVFLFAPLVIVPLGLPLVDATGREMATGRLLRLCQPIGAAGVAASFLLPAGIPAAALVSAWLGVSGLAALQGLSRAWRRGVWPVHEACVDAALLLLPVGAGWLAFSRAGLRPMGFNDTIVFLTALHFHYAGFAAALLAGLAGRALVAPGRLYQVIAAGVVGGVPLLAAGFTLSPVLKVAAAIVLAVSLAGLASLTLARVLRRLSSIPARLLMALSSVSVLAPMVLAVVYAEGEFTGNLHLSIPDMARWHGILNAFGFSLCGLLAWTLERRPWSRLFSAGASHIQSRSSRGSTSMSRDILRRSPGPMSRV